LFTAVFSSTQTFPACRLFRVSYLDSTVEGIALTPAGWIVEPRGEPAPSRNRRLRLSSSISALDSEYNAPELFNATIGSGEMLYGMVFKPHNLRSGKKYPVVLNVYGGPEVQLVSNSFKGTRMIRNHLLASQGFCVVCIDSRGSDNRGVAFESHIRLKMGQLEMADQVEVLRWLANVTGFMDMSRVAVHGWSYGGYLSLMGLAQYPSVFKVAVAGAPVVQWLCYDTGYTERFMDLPRLNPTGYLQGCVLTHLPNFPDE